MSTEMATSMIHVSATPKTQTGQLAKTTPSPGTWRHPRFDEISRRQNATTFNGKNVQTVQWNGGALFLTYLSGWLLEAFNVRPDIILPLGAQPYLRYAVVLIRVLLITNLTLAFLPLIRNKDNLADIPLTPSQRALLGLDPNATPPTPAAQYVTPPRYPRSPTPRSSTPDSRKSSQTYSPMSQRASPSFGGRMRSDSPFSPSGSPLDYKGISAGQASIRRQSYGFPSPLRPGIEAKEFSFLGTPDTSNPSSGRSASVSLNSRWFYEKGRGSPGSRGF